jgi:signal transduction histidine kinase
MEVEGEPDQSKLQNEEKTLEGVLKGMHGGGISVLNVIRNEVGELADLRYCQVSETVLEHMNRPAQEVIGQSMRQLVPGINRTRFWEAFETVLVRGEPQSFDEHYNHDGYDNWLQARVSRLNENQLICTYILVNEAKQVGQQVQEQTGMLRVLCDTAPWGILMIEPILAADGTIKDFRLRLTNRISAGLAQKTVDQMEGQPLGELLPTFLPAPFMDTIRQVYVSGAEQRTTFCHQDGGRNTWFDTSFMPYKEGVLVTLLDISALKESQLVEQQTASLLQHILDSSLTAIVLVDPLRDEQGVMIDFSCRMANEAFVKASRQPLQAIIGQTMLTIHPHLKGSETLQRYFDVVETCQPQQFEQLMPTRHGAMWLSVSVVRQGHGLVISFLDITPLKTYQQQLQELVGQLEHSNQQLEQFASVASHDMQEPLRKIQSFGSILLSDYREALPERGQDFLRRMQQAAARMQQLVKDLLTYSRLSTQQFPVDYVDLNHVLTEALTDLELTIEEKAAQVQLSLLPTIQGNAFQLRQLFFNLVGNALKFHQPDLAPVVNISSVELAAHQAPSSLSSKYPDLPVTLITVADKGIGFEEHYKDRIFKPFQRLHGHSQYAGTGIGLAICRQVVEGHGGTLEVQSKPGEGTTFFIYLPLKS